MRVLVTGASGMLGNAVLRTLWEKVVLPRVLAKENAHALFCPEGVIALKNVPSGCTKVTIVL
jgi:nucleoside-diphosphate-sugar epimerase